MHNRLLILAAAPLLMTTGCGSHSVADQSKAAMAAQAQCQSRLDRQLHIESGSRSGSEWFVHDLGNGRLRVTGSVPARAGLTHPESYTCVVATGSSGPHIVEFNVRRTT
jgi:hypothetical protein